MSDYDDVIASLEERGLDEEAEVLKKYRAGSLREQASKAPALEQENQALQAKVKALEDAPKRTAALRAAYVDIDALSPADLEVIDGQQLEDGQEYDEDWARGLVERYGLPVSDRVEVGPLPPAAGIVDAATNTGAIVQGKTSLTPSEVASWDVSKRMRFAEWDDQNKTGYMARILAGETIAGIAFD